MMVETTHAFVKLKQIKAAVSTRDLNFTLVGQRPFLRPLSFEKGSVGSGTLVDVALVAQVAGSWDFISSPGETCMWAF